MVYVSLYRLGSHGLSISLQSRAASVLLELVPFYGAEPVQTYMALKFKYKF